MEYHRTRSLWCILCSHKWNYYLKGAGIIVCNDPKALAKFLNGKNENNKVNRWGLELATYNITFEWISGTCNKAADCLSCLVELPQDRPATINMLSATNLDGPAFNPKGRTAQSSSSEDTTPETDAVDPNVIDTPSTTPKSLTADRLQALLQMQTPIHSVKESQNDCQMEKHQNTKADLFLHVKGLLYKYVTDSHEKFLALVIPKAWRYTVLVEAHDKLGHQGATWTYCLMKHHYYWKGMSKDIRKYIAQSVLCHREKAKVQAYPVQMTEIIDLVTDCETSSSGNKHILIIIDFLTGGTEAFPIPDKSADTIVSKFINQYLPVHMCPRYTLLDKGMEFKNHLMDQVPRQLGIDPISFTPYHPQSNGKLEVFHKYLKPTLKKLSKKDPLNWDKYINQVLTSTKPCLS